MHLHYSRWTFQCKRTESVEPGDLAKEIGLGLATLFKAHVVVMVTTGRFGASVEQHAAEAMRTTSLQIVLLDGDALHAYLRKGRAALLAHLHENAGHTLRLKRAQVIADAEMLE